MQRPKSETTTGGISLQVFSSNQLSEDSFRSSFSISMTEADSESDQSPQISAESLLAQRDKIAAYREAINKMTPFSFCGDQNLKNLPQNYFLYLEFFHMSIKIFVGLLLFSIVLYIAYFTILDLYPEIETSTTAIFAIVGLFASSGLFLRILRERLEKRLVEHSILANIPWTEDLFSLLVEGLPKETTQREITAFFNNILLQENGGGFVKHVILLQDYHEYAQIKQKIRAIDKKLKSLGGNESGKLKLLSRKSLLSGLLGQLEVEIIDLKNFKGKAIVIFNTIQSKQTICEYFNINSKRAYFSKDPKYFFKSKRFRLAQLPEPQDLLFENVHYTTGFRVFLTTLVYLASFGLATLVVLGFLTISFDPEFQFESFDAIKVQTTLSSPLFIFAMMVLSYIFRKGYRSINRFFIYSSALEAETNTFSYTIWISLFIYVPTTLVPSFIGDEPPVENLIYVPMFFLMKKLFFKTISICSTNKTERRPSAMSLNDMLVSSKDNQKNPYEIDFIEGINGTIPLVFMGFTSMIVNLFLLVPLVVLSLYILTVIEKLRIKRFFCLQSQKSVSYMLRAFTIYRWDCFCAFAICFVVLKIASDSIFSGEAATEATLYFCIFGFIAVLCFVWWPESLDEQVKREFIKRNLNVSYDSAKKDFLFFYQTQDPLKRITN